MKLLALTRYSRLGASSRLRMLQYVPYLSSAGFSVDVASFFDDRYLTELYEGKRPSIFTARYFASRLRKLMLGVRPDVLWLEKEAFQWLPWMVEKQLLPRNVPIVSDYDDAVFHRYDLHRSALVRSMLTDKIDQVMARSDLVMAGNAYLAGRARDAGAKAIEIIPTVVDMDHYSVERRPVADRRPRIGWIGSPSTWTAYCEPLLPTLISSAQAHSGVFRAVGASPAAKSNDVIEVLPWSEDTEVPLIQGMDIGVMPLDDNPWARGKCGYKLIQYMACGVPVIASPVGVNAIIVEHGVNGFLADSESEWAAALNTLMVNADLRRQMGLAGREMVERKFSLQVYGPKVARLVVDVARANRPVGR